MTKTLNRNESGNVLFLILIAVALFAALSYAVTQSTRSGGGSTENETNILDSASITQYPAALRTSVVRMILNGKGVDTILFNTPSDFSLETDKTILVFHPSGGGGIYQDGSDFTTDTWYFNGDFEVPELGTTGAGGNELIAFLPQVSTALCAKINEQLDVSTGSTNANTGIPVIETSTINLADVQVNVDTDTGNFNASGTGTAITNTSSDFNGTPTACFETSDGDFVFYSVLLER